MPLAWPPIRSWQKLLPKDFSGLNTIINQTLKYIFIVMPFSVVFMILNKEVVAILFQRGAFDAHDAAPDIRGAAVFHGRGILHFQPKTIVSRGFLPFLQTHCSLLFSSVCVALSLPLLYFCNDSHGDQRRGFGPVFVRNHYHRGFIRSVEQKNKKRRTIGCLHLLWCHVTGQYPGLAGFKGYICWNYSSDSNHWFFYSIYSFVLLSAYSF